MFARGLSGSETQASHAPLIPTEMMSELVAQRPLDLAGEQVPVMAEVPFQGVAIDDYPVLVPFTRDAVSEVLTICVLIRSEIGDDDRDAGEHFLKFIGEAIDRIYYQ